MTGSSTACLCHIENGTQGFSHARQALCPHPQTSPICPWEMNGSPNFQSPSTTGQTCFIKILLIPRADGHSNLKVGHPMTLSSVCGRGPGAPAPTSHVLPPADTKAHSLETIQHLFFRDSPLSRVAAVGSACCPTQLFKLCYKKQASGSPVVSVKHGSSISAKLEQGFYQLWLTLTSRGKPQ